MQSRMAIMLFLGFMITTADVWAQVPRLVHYQGQLKNSDGTPFEGTTDIRFGIYAKPDSEQPIWTETHENVQVRNGNYEVLLGSKNPLDLSFYEYYLQVEAEATDDGSESSRIAIVGSGYNFRLWFLFAAYTIVWLAIFAYLLSIARRQKRVIAELQALGKSSEVGV